MRKPIQLIILLLVASNLFSQSAFDKSVMEASTDLANKLILEGKKKIAVLYITDIGKTQTVAGKYIADVISVNLVNNAGHFEIFDRENLSGMAEAKKLIAEGYIDVDKAKALGKMLSVEVIIIGNYTVLSNTLKLTLKAFDSNTGLVIAATGKELPIDADAGTLLGIIVETSGGRNNSNRGFNNRPLNSNEDYNNPETVSKDCEKNHTGDYCFHNSRSNEITVMIDVKNTITSSDGVGKMTLGPGQTQCFYNLAARPYYYFVYDKTSYNFYFPKVQGQFWVEQCKSKTFLIR